MSSCLLLAAEAAGDAAACAALVRRMELAGVPVVAIGALPGPPATGVAAVVPADGWRARTLMAAVRERGAEAARSWLVCRDPAAIAAAATAGLAGVVLVGVDPPAGEHALVVARAESLADATRVMVPRGGGCWHDHRRS